MIREARQEDLPVLREVDRAAGEPFRDIGMSAIADSEPATLDELAAHQRAGTAWVWGDPPVAFVLADEVDGYAHLAQVSVHPGHSRRGIGRRLIDHVGAWAAERGLAGLSLTTFTDVPWNAPYYARLGFVTVAGLPPGLRAIRENEAARGLDAWPRTAMRRLTIEAGPPG